MSEVLNGYIIQILQLIVLSIAALLAQAAKRLYEKHVNTDIKRDVVRTVVRCVEQIYVDLHGRDKLEMAMDRATLILKEDYNISIGDYELISLIEAAVNEFNDTFAKTDEQKPPDEEDAWDKPFTNEEFMGMTD